jgi:TonB family protein
VTLAIPREAGPSIKREENPIPLRLASSKGDNLFLALPSAPSKEMAGIPFPDNGSHGGPQKGEKSVHREASSEGSTNVASLAPSSDGKIASARPKYDKNPKPLYPPEATKMGYEGEVLLRVEVLSNGRVGQVEVNRSSGHEILDRSALAAVKQWEFIPAKKGETAVSEWVRIPIPFKLKTNKTIVVIDGRSR